MAVMVEKLSCFCQFLIQSSSSLAYFVKIKWSSRTMAKQTTGVVSTLELKNVTLLAPTVFSSCISFLSYLWT